MSTQTRSPARSRARRRWEQFLMYSLRSALALELILIIGGCIFHYYEPLIVLVTFVFPLFAAVVGSLVMITMASSVFVRVLGVVFIAFAGLVSYVIVAGMVATY